MPLTVKYRDTRPARWRAVEQKSKLPLDLTGSTAEVHVRLRKTSGSATTIPATIPAPATEGFVQFSTAALDVGTYDLEVELTASGGETATAPTVGFETLVVGPDLA